MSPDPSRQVGDNQNAPRFTADTAARTGQSERAVQRDAERGEKVCEEALTLKQKPPRCERGGILSGVAIMAMGFRYEDGSLSCA